MDRLSLPRSGFSDADAALSHEWLVANGLGGFASGTVAQANTRRYHGLLVAALRPPLDRILMVAKLDAIVRYNGITRELACNEFADGTLAPRGFERLTEFSLQGQSPVWTFAIGDAILEQHIWMDYGQNTVYVRYQLLSGTAPLDLELVPLCTYRDYHSHTRGSWPLRVDAYPRECTVTAFDGARPYKLFVDRGAFNAATDWYWRFQHREEAQRGLDAQECLFRPGVFRAQLVAGEAVTFIGTAELAEPRTPAIAWEAELTRTRKLICNVQASAPAWIRQLTLAADAYIVARADRSGALVGKTVIAGYPWFSDWGRDTMIALPGLALTTGRYDDAANIIRTFAQHLSDGMLPNRFPDGGETPEYNTVDATLWYFHAIQCYLDASGDQTIIRDLYPALRDVIRWHQRGTRFGIRVDTDDGLLRAGEPGVQLTWMDAKVGDWVVTPRVGKPVEINALWHFAVNAMSRWATELDELGDASEYRKLADQIALNFRRRFWNDAAGCLFDVVDAPGALPNDASIRPNQIFAVSLGADLLEARDARAVVDTCARELLTPMGLRSLAPGDPAYIAHYRGGPLERDGSYHQGTVWSWLLGPFVIAHWRVHGDVAHGQGILSQLGPHLASACVGQISEIFDADPPYTPRGCIAQAWSVAETLRAWQVINAATNTTSRRLTNA